MVIHISTLLLSIYPQNVDMLWITVFFCRFLSTNTLFWSLFLSYTEWKNY